MPFIKVMTDCAISAEQETELKARFGKAIALVPGKSESHLLLLFADRCHMWLRGERNRPIAYVEAAIFGNERHDGYGAFSAEITRALWQTLHIPPERVYIKYDDIGVWAAGGQTIDRRAFR